MNRKLRLITIIAATIVVLVGTSRPLPADTSSCSGVATTLPFNDVATSSFFCQIANAYFSGLTNGTSATTYSPTDSVPREQMAAFVTRTQDGALKRGSRRAALRQWATPSVLPPTGKIPIGNTPWQVESDGADLWVTEASEVKRVRASDGKVLDTWTGATGAFGVLVARGRVYVTGRATPGAIYVIDPSLAGPGPVGTLSSTLGVNTQSITTDGTLIWTSNFGGSISKVNPDTSATTNIATGFVTPSGILFDGANIWVSDAGDNMLKKLDSNGAIIQSVPVVNGPALPVFDGANIWVPTFNSNSLTVVRVRDGMVLATLTGNGLNQPWQAAFDGQRILVSNLMGNTVSMWKATDLTAIGNFSTGAGAIPWGVCSDGVNFWMVLQGTNQLARL
jgi:hypothetical protein